MTTSDLRPLAASILILALSCASGCSYDPQLEGTTCSDRPEGATEEGKICKNGYWVAMDTSVVDSGPPARDADADASRDAMDGETGGDVEVGMDADTGVDVDAGPDAETGLDVDGGGDADTIGDTEDGLDTGDTMPLPDGDTTGDVDAVGDTGDTEPSDTADALDTTDTTDTVSGDTSDGGDGTMDTSDTTKTDKAAGATCSSDTECASGRCLSDPNGSGKVCAHQVFLSSTQTSGNITTTSSGNQLTGLQAADQICQDRAAAAGMGNRTWKAILSETNNGAASRLQYSAAIVDSRSSPVKVADSKSHLWSTSRDLANSIEYDETGMQLTTNLTVWTGTNTDGTPNAQNCVDWGSQQARDKGRVGDPTTNDTNNWVDTNDKPCNRSLRLYCIDGQ